MTRGKGSTRETERQKEKKRWEKQKRQYTKIAKYGLPESINILTQSNAKKKNGQTKKNENYELDK